MGHARHPAKSFGLALPKQPQVNLEILLPFFKLIIVYGPQTILQFSEWLFADESFPTLILEENRKGNRSAGTQLCSQILGPWKLYFKAPAFQGCLLKGGEQPLLQVKLTNPPRF